MILPIIGGNKANATSDEGDMEPIKRPTASAAIPCRLVKPRNVLNFPFWSLANGYMSEPNIALNMPIRGSSEIALDIKYGNVLYRLDASSTETMDFSFGKDLIVPAMAMLVAPIIMRLSKPKRSITDACVFNQ
jgi:hypothetical protein